MPGYAFHLETLKQAADASDPATAELLNTPAAALGAMGPDILMYTPPSAQLAAALPDLLKGFSTMTPAQKMAVKTEIEEVRRKPLGCAYSALFSEFVTQTWPPLNALDALLAQAATIAQKEESSQLSSFFSQATAVQSSLTALSTSIPAGINVLFDVIAPLIALGPWMETAAASGISGQAPSAYIPACRTYEYLRWHRAGDFAEALLETARASKNPEQEAFALGWLVHLAASVTGEPFVNNIAGGPYRTHWWRNRLVANYVDSWTWGFFETSASMGGPTGDTPTPEYEKWSSLCEAKLHERFNVGNLPGPASPGAMPTAVTAMASGDLGALPQSFPDEIHKLLEVALVRTYPTGTPMPDPAGSLSPDTFAEAYVGAFAVFWFLTASEGPLANNAPGKPPAGCGTSAPGTSSSSTAPPPQPQGVTSGSEACEIILAILAVLALLIGEVAGAIALLVAALEEKPSINWQKVQCYVYWAGVAIDALNNALRDALVTTTLAYPPPILLGGLDVKTGEVVPATDFTPMPGSAPPSTSSPTTFAGNTAPNEGMPLTRTNEYAANTGYPRALDKLNKLLPLADYNYLHYPLPPTALPPTTAAGGLLPGVPVEQQATDDMIESGKYADYILSGAGLASAEGMLDPGPSLPTGAPASPSFFGDALHNALKLVAAGGKGLANFNLDGDRGYGWLDWHPALGTDPRTGTVDAVED